MCGIFGYVGKTGAYKKVLEGLKLLQYRGYDSCGIAYFDNGFKITKAIGVLDNLKTISTETSIAIGHTRWATHGEVNLQNTHPHHSYNGKYVIVHNGVISNVEDIKRDLLKNKVQFYSQTDTEVIINLLAAMRGDFERNIIKIFDILQGSYALIIGNNSTGDLYLIKKFSPLNVLIANDGIYISSDINSLKSGKLYSLRDGDILKISKNKVSKINGEDIIYTKYSNDIKTLKLGKYKHFMIKEIHEIPLAIKNTYNYITQINLTKIFKKYNKLTMLGCGTAYHSCMIGEYLFNNYTKKVASSFLASNYTPPDNIKNKHLHIIVSQSGETADCIRIAEHIKQNHGKLLVITNESKSSITKYADYLLVTQANKELAVASTKTYCAQIFVFAYICNVINNKNYKLNILGLTKHLFQFIDNISIEEKVNQLLNTDRLILMGIGIDYLTILEASLKIREIDYIYTIPIISSELKHGTLSLIDKSTKVLALNTDIEDKRHQLAVNEIKSRGGGVIEFDKIIELNNITPEYRPIFNIIPFQILSYSIAVKKGLNPDMPRNLAKSVTVE